MRVKGSIGISFSSAMETGAVAHAVPPPLVVVHRVHVEHADARARDRPQALDHLYTGFGRGTTCRLLFFWYCALIVHVGISAPRSSDAHVMPSMVAVASGRGGRGSLTVAATVGVSSPSAVQRHRISGSPRHLSRDCSTGGRLHGPHEAHRELALLHGPARDRGQRLVQAVGGRAPTFFMRSARWAPRRSRHLGGPRSARAESRAKPSSRPPAVVAHRLGRSFDSCTAR